MSASRHWRRSGGVGHVPYHREGMGAAPRSDRRRSGLQAKHWHVYCDGMTHATRCLALRGIHAAGRTAPGNGRRRSPQLRGGTRTPGGEHPYKPAAMATPCSSRWANCSRVLSSMRSAGHPVSLPATLIDARCQLADHVSSGAHQRGRTGRQLDREQTAQEMPSLSGEKPPWVGGLRRWFLEPTRGIEPRTPSLRVMCSAS